MGVGEGGAVGLYEGGMASHAHVRLHVGCGVAFGVEQVETEAVGGVRRDGLGAIPDHHVAVGQTVEVAKLTLAERLRRPLALGVQKVSRPMERCQETSQAPPMEDEVTVSTPHQMYQGTVAASLTHGRLPGEWRCALS
jgi:hypothetical protein